MNHTKIRVLLEEDFMNRFFIVFMALFYFIACGTAGTQQENRPEWTQYLEGKIDLGESFAFVGQSSAIESVEAALASAKSKAWSTVTIYFGVKVSASYETDNKATYKSEIKYSTESVKVKNYNIKSFVEKESEEYNAWVMIEIPKTEFERIRKEVEELEKKKNALSVWALKSNNSEACKGKIKQKLFPFLKEKKGLNIIEQDIDFDKSTEEITKQHPNYAYFLKIECDEVKTDLAYNDKTFLYYINLKITLNDLKTGVMVSAWAADNVKGAKIVVDGNERYMVDGDAVSQAIEIIKEQIN